MDVQPFEIHIQEEVLEDLRRASGPYPLAR